MNFQELAQQFIEEEKQFHLGDLITEKPHSKTSGLSSGIKENISHGAKMLLEVDQDIIPVAKKIFQSAEYDQLVSAMLNCITDGHTVCFSSCGASGRLAIILDAMWRSYWIETRDGNPDLALASTRIENQVYSIMTGGERALIRSVENFEDYQAFGRRQFKDSKLGEGDLLVALTEGGEISSVIGSMKEALDRGAGVIMIHNNPSKILRQKFERSREMLDNPAVVKIDLTTGPMALAGSTRMQATTIAMLVAGAAMEECFEIILTKAQERGNPLSQPEVRSLSRSSFPENFTYLLEQLMAPGALKSISELIDIEAECYKKSGRVTYLGQTYLLDILSDTTERAPTFMLPPFRQYDDTDSPVPWAFARDPLRDSADAWTSLLKRSPRGLDWTRTDYQDMAVPEDMIERLPQLGVDQIMKFHIGKEEDCSRYDCPYSVLMSVFVNEAISTGIEKWWNDHADSYSSALILTIGNGDEKSTDPSHIHIPLDIPESRTSIFEHLAIKIIFNVLSTGTMARIGRVIDNWMIQLDATNKKLTDRATRVIAHFSGLPYEEACLELFKTMNEPDSHRLEFKDSYIIQTLKRLDVPVGD